MGKKWMWGAVAALGGLAVVSNIMLNTALKRKPTVQPVLSETEALDAWFLEGAVRWTQMARCDLRLNAWFVPKPDSRRYAIVCHGYGCSSKMMRHRAKVFADMGFNILLPDARAHGESDGEMIGMGWPERRDIVNWIYEILKMDSDAEILLFGESMGAATVMMTAGEVLPDNVKLVIEDCGYTDVMDEMNHTIRAKYKLPGFPIVPVASLFAHFRAGYTFTKASAVKQVSRCRIPMLFLHAEEDKVVPFPMVFKLYAAARCEKEMVTFPGAGHCQCAETDPERYWGTIRAFIEKHMD
ncbi:MAG: alpha/beta hydrolase [Clostridia bacterium]|nr:alpha/beta hydrolase [Clostridia bacterium]